MLTKRIIFTGTLLLLMGTSALGYEDHRGVAVDSLEAVLASPHPPKGEELIRVYMDLMRACEVAMAERQWKQALEYGLKSVHEEDEVTFGDAGSYALLAQIYTELGEKDLARAYINKVYQVMERSATEHYQSGLSQIDVQLLTAKDHTTVVVADNGRGMEVQSASGEVQGDGAGLMNIRERLAAIGGSIIVDSSPGRGTEIHIEIPSEA